jgi:hypothetical protein
MFTSVADTENSLVIFCGIFERATNAEDRTIKVSSALIFIFDFVGETKRQKAIFFFRSTSAFNARAAMTKANDSQSQ